MNYLSNTKELTLPSGHKMTIREQNGEDDAILSNRLLSATGKNFDAFISQITLETDLTQSRKLTLDDIDMMPSLDFGYAIFASRVFSLGEEIKYSYKWYKDKPPINYIENLSQFVPDFLKPQPQLGEPGYFVMACPMYPNGKTKEINFTTSRNKNVRYNILTRGGEKKLLEFSPDKQNINTKLILREFKLEVNKDQWVKVTNFQEFSPKEMREIRADVSKNDPDWAALSDIENPETGEIRSVDMLGLPDFFFPAEI